MRIVLYLLQKWLFIALSVLLAALIVSAVTSLADPINLSAVLSGNYGDSLARQQPALDIVQEHVGVTTELVLYGTLLSWLIGSALGVGLAALRRSGTDVFVRPLLIFLLAVPLPVLALWLILQLGVQANWLPIGGRTPISLTGTDETTFASRLPYLVMPVLSLVLIWGSAAAVFIRRSGLIYTEDAIRASAAALPTLASGLFSSVVLIEVIFAYPGAGRLLVEGISMRDAPVIAAAFMSIVWRTTIFYAAMVLVITIVEAIIRKPNGITAYPFLWLVGGDELPPEYPPEEVISDDTRLRAALDNAFTLIASLAALLILAVIVLCFVPPLVTNLDPGDINPAMRFSPPGTENRPLGTDALGRDLQVRLLFGGRTTLAMSFYIAISALIGGAFLGLIGGAAKGVLGGVLSLPLNALTTFAITVPLIPLLILAAANPNNTQVWMLIAGMIAAAPAGILFRQMIRARRRTNVANWFALVGLVLALGTAYGIVTEVTISFLGLGVQPPTPSWGNLLTDAQIALRQAPYLITIPGATITVTVFALLTVAARLRDTLPF